MMTAEENRRLTEVGAGTPMGELMRRHWHPIAPAAEMRTPSTKAIRLLGEDLVLYRDRSGTYGLLDRHCPHRNADLMNGYVEECGIRCGYHGWRFDEAGACREQPFEDTVNPGDRFRESVRAVAYPVEEKAGLLWAYLGPDPAPLIPTWEPFTYEHCFVRIAVTDVACNWLQCQENSIDPVHLEWLHFNWSNELQGKVGERAAKHLEISFAEWEYGLAYRRSLEGAPESMWLMDRLCILPNLFAPGHFEWRVPIDDFHTRNIAWHYTRVPEDMEPFEQGEIPYWYSTGIDPMTGELLKSHVLNQDSIAWLGQGVVSDRTREHLGRSDRGVIMLRRQLERDMQAVAEGRDPKGVIRDPIANQCIEFPQSKTVEMKQGLPRDIWLALDSVANPVPNDFFLVSGQPPGIQADYEAAIGRGRT